jgi:hypothetical protein
MTVMKQIPDPEDDAATNEESPYTVFIPREANPEKGRICPSFDNYKELYNRMVFPNVVAVEAVEESRKECSPLVIAYSPPLVIPSIEDGRHPVTHARVSAFTRQGNSDYTGRVAILGGIQGVIRQITAENKYGNQTFYNMVRKFNQELKTTGNQDLSSYLRIEEDARLFIRLPKSESLVPIRDQRGVFFGSKEAVPSNHPYAATGSRLCTFSTEGEYITNVQKLKRETEGKGGWCILISKSETLCWYDLWRVKGTCLASLINSSSGAFNEQNLKLSPNCMLTMGNGTGSGSPRLIHVQATRPIYAAVQLLHSFVIGETEFPASYRAIKRVSLQSTAHLRNLDKISGTVTDEETVKPAGWNKDPMKQGEVVGMLGVHLYLASLDPRMLVATTLAEAIQLILASAQFKVELHSRPEEEICSVTGTISVFAALCNAGSTELLSEPTTIEEAKVVLTKIHRHIEEHLPTALKATQKGHASGLTERSTSLLYERDKSICNKEILPVMAQMASLINDMSVAQLKGIIDGTLFGKFTLPVGVLLWWQEDVNKTQWIRSVAGPGGAVGGASLFSSMRRIKYAADVMGFSYVDVFSALSEDKCHIIVDDTKRKGRDSLYGNFRPMEDRRSLSQDFEVAAATAAIKVIRDAKNKGVILSFSIPELGEGNV